MDTRVLVLSRTIPSSSTSNLGPSIPIIETNIETDEPRSSVLITHVAKKGNLNDKSFKISKTLELPNFHGLNLSLGKMVNYTNVWGARFCIEVERREKVLVPKLDGLHKHSGEESVSMQNLGKRYANITSILINNMQKMNGSMEGSTCLDFVYE